MNTTLPYWLNQRWHLGHGFTFKEARGYFGEGQNFSDTPPRTLKTEISALRCFEKALHIQKCTKYLFLGSGEKPVPVLK